MNEHAQYEIRVFANAMAQIVKDAVPICYKAFEDYHLNAMRLSGSEKELIKNNKWPKTAEDAWVLAFARFDNKRESAEFVDKLKELGMISQQVRPSQ
jgi:thymidylate synthase ThyX